MNWETVCHYIAQGAINITEGHTTIEANSPVHTAMKAFCEYATTGRIELRPPPSKRARKRAGVPK